MSALFDLLAGPWLDKKMLSAGIRVASMRRLMVSALALRLYVLPPPTWQEVVAWALAVLALDLQGAVTAAPRAALEAIGGGIGAVVGRVRSAYRVGRSVGPTAPGERGEDFGPGPQNPDGAVG